MSLCIKNHQSLVVLLILKPPYLCKELINYRHETVLIPLRTVYEVLSFIVIVVKSWSLSEHRNFSSLNIPIEFVAFFKYECFDMVARICSFPPTNLVIDTIS